MDCFNIRIQRDDLVLIPIDFCHKEDIFREFTTEITRYMFPCPSEDINGVDEFIAKSRQNMVKGTDIQLVIVNGQNDEFLGCVGLHNINESVPEFGIWLKKSSHGNKYGRRAIHMLYDFAVENFNFTAFKYPVDRDNIPSRRIPESLGGKIVREYEEKDIAGDTLHLVEYMVPINDKNRSNYMDNRTLKARVGNMEQIAYARRMEFTEGKADGLRAIEVNNGAGLSLNILESRGLDIGNLSYKGNNISFLAKPGFVAPALASYVPGEFTRHFYGGMLYTCGLDNIGPNYVDESGQYPVHGRLSTTPATYVNAVVDWDSNVITVSGNIRLNQLFGGDLVMKRVISIPIMGNSISIRDRVVNEGFQDDHIMLLYHFNFGYPMLSENTRLEVTHSSVIARDADAQKGIDIWNSFEEPSDYYREQVFYHVPATADGLLAHAVITNQDINTQVKISYDPQMLPHLIQWKSMKSGDYALGIEPATCLVEGYEKEYSAGRLLKIRSSEEKEFKVILEFGETKY